MAYDPSHLPLPHTEDMHKLRTFLTCDEIPEGARYIRWHTDGTHEFLTQEEYNKLWQNQ